MSKSRLEAFSDGVIAILITILVLEFKVPQGSDVAALRPLLPTALAYLLSFVYVGIYWNNHHHMLHATDKVDGRILWANLHLLFWLSLVPFATAWMGQSRFPPVPVALYGVVMFMAGFAYYLLQAAIIRRQGPQSQLRRALGADWKGKLSNVLNGSAVPLAFVSPWASLSVYVVVAVIWFVPDRRIERRLNA